MESSHPHWRQAFKIVLKKLCPITWAQIQGSQRSHLWHGMAWGMGLSLDIFGPSHVDGQQRHAETTTEMPHLGLRITHGSGYAQFRLDACHLDPSRPDCSLSEANQGLVAPPGQRLSINVEKRDAMRAQFAMRGRMLFERGSFSSPSGGMCWNPYVLGACKAFPMRRWTGQWNWNQFSEGLGRNILQLNAYAQTDSTNCRWADSPINSWKFEKSLLEKPEKCHHRFPQQNYALVHFGHPFFLQGEKVQEAPAVSSWDHR